MRVRHWTFIHEVLQWFQNMCIFLWVRLLTSVRLSKYYCGYQIQKNEMGGACCTYRGEKRCIQGFGGATWEKELLGRPTHERIILKCTLSGSGMGTWTGLIWLRIRTLKGHLWMRQWTFGFHKMRGISWPTENRLASQEGLCCME